MFKRLIFSHNLSNENSLKKIANTSKQNSFDTRIIPNSFCSLATTVSTSSLLKRDYCETLEQSQAKAYKHMKLICGHCDCFSRLKKGGCFYPRIFLKCANLSVSHTFLSRRSISWDLLCPCERSPVNITLGHLLISTDDDSAG